MDESLLSGMDNLGNLIGNNVGMDAALLARKLDLDPTSEVKVVEVDQIDSGAGGEAGGGKLKGWKEKLAKMREQKEQQRKIIEESFAEHTPGGDSRDESFQKV